MSKRRPIVGVGVVGVTSYGRQIMRGVMRYANLRRRWLIFQEFRIEIADLATWPQCDGAILTVGQAERMEFLRAPLSLCRQLQRRKRPLRGSRRLP